MSRRALESSPFYLKASNITGLGVPQQEAFNPTSGIIIKSRSDLGLSAQEKGACQGHSELLNPKDKEWHFGISTNQMRNKLTVQSAAAGDKNSVTTLRKRPWVSLVEASGPYLFTSSIFSLSVELRDLLSTTLRFRVQLHLCTTIGSFFFWGRGGCVLSFVAINTLFIY